MSVNISNKKLISLILLFQIIYCGVQVYEGEFDYSQSGKEWGGKCSVGRKQSPIDFPSTTKMKYDPKVKLEWIYNNLENVVLQDDAETMKVVSPNIGTLQVTYSDGKIYHYNAKEFHFHAPSEHIWQGKYYDLEMHIFHELTDDYKAKYPKIKPFAVVGIWFDSRKNYTNSFINELKFDDKEENINVKFGDFMASIPKRFQHYEGSRTVPPCDEGVNWFISDVPQPISLSQKALIYEYWEEDPLFADGNGNNRKVMALNGRIVTRNYEINSNGSHYGILFIIMSLYFFNIFL